MHDAEQLAALVESTRMDEVARKMVDDGLDNAIDPDTKITMSDAVWRLVKLGFSGGRLAGINIFEAEAKRIIEAEIERYAADNAAELSALLDEQAAELTGGE
jgi:hypothetical protein